MTVRAEKREIRNKKYYELRTTEIFLSKSCPFGDETDHEVPILLHLTINSLLIHHDLQNQPLQLLKWITTCRRYSYILDAFIVIAMAASD